ncbi:MAG: DNA-binding protein WhiA [Clostridiales bacterium]|nr:DNA-binding protein WhiA [Clostridiales bacterium]
MSFGQETKNELARFETDKNCCKLAEIASFIRMAGSIGLAGGGKFNIILKTENAAVARHFKVLIKDYFRIEPVVEYEEGGNLSRGNVYVLKITPDMGSEAILREVGILMIKQGNNYISDGIYMGIIRTKCCRKSYLRGSFLAAGTITNPEKSYQMEWRCGSERMAKDLLRLIGTFDALEGKMTKRKNYWVVYVKASGYISDLLALMGAHGKVLELENIMITKELRSEAVRMTNCDTANMDRVLNASEKQITDIKKIIERKGENFLPEKLRDIARLRLENPEASLTQLGEMLTPPLKKSGVNNRLRKISDIAGSL